MTDPTAWVCKPWQSRPPLRDARPIDPAGSPAGFRLREGVAMLPVSPVASGSRQQNADASH